MCSRIHANCTERKLDNAFGELFAVILLFMCTAAKAIIMSFQSTFWCCH